jgi:DNA repair protein RadC
MKELLTLREDIGRVECARDAFNKIKRINIDFTQENFLVLFLDTKNKLIASEVLFKGGLRSCDVDPKTLFRRALMHNANSLIVGHNHPSGGLEPSFEDVDVMNKLNEVGKLLTLNILDCLIFNEKEYHSIHPKTTD